MQINLKIVGVDLFRAVSSAIRLRDPAFSHFNQNEVIEWNVGYKSSDLEAEDLLGFADVPSALLLDGQDKALFDKMRSLERQMLAFVKNNPDMPLVPSPVIAVLPSPASLVEMADFPDIIADWVYAPVAMPDIARRILFSLRRRGMIKARRQFGGITIVPETRQAVYEDRSTRLTPSEFTLLELFLGQMGAVIPFKDLVSFFKSTGKSAEPNNIRVAIFQLRLKLEILTKSRITVASIHKQGYCLRQKNCTQAREHMSSVWNMVF